MESSDGRQMRFDIQGRRPGSRDQICARSVSKVGHTSSNSASRNSCRDAFPKDLRAPRRQGLLGYMNHRSCTLTTTGQRCGRAPRRGRRVRKKSRESAGGSCSLPRRAQFFRYRRKLSPRAKFVRGAFTKTDGRASRPCRGLVEQLAKEVATAQAEATRQVSFSLPEPSPQRGRALRKVFGRNGESK